MLARAVLVVSRHVCGQEKLDIIKDLNGVFHPGRLTALMGPSGSGKTTLMDILAGRKSGAGKIQGEVQLGMRVFLVVHNTWRLYGGSPAPTAVLTLVGISIALLTMTSRLL